LRVFFFNGSEALIWSQRCSVSLPIFCDIGEKHGCFLWLTGEMRQGARQCIHQLRDDADEEQSLPAFFKLQTTVVPALVFVPSQHGMCNQYQSTSDNHWIGTHEEWWAHNATKVKYNCSSPRLLKTQAAAFSFTSPIYLPLQFWKHHFSSIINYLFFSIKMHKQIGTETKFWKMVW
jgi:hypothetical protein